MVNQSVFMIKKGVKASLPIVLGYIPVALTYGVLAEQSGLNLLELTLMSALVYAGASQFMGVNMIVAGSGALEIIVATFVLNFRHFVMNLSFMNSIRGQIKLNNRLIMSAGLTDETFAVASLHKSEAAEEKGTLFYFTIILFAYFSWVLGSFVGGLLGGIIPETLSESMGIALYAMFIGLLVPSVKREWRIGLIAIIAMLISMIAANFLSTGWAIVLGTIIGGFSGVFLLKENMK